MVKRHMKRCSPFIRERQIKTTILLSPHTCQNGSYHKRQETTVLMRMWRKGILVSSQFIHNYSNPTMGAPPLSPNYLPKPHFQVPLHICFDNEPAFIAEYSIQGTVVCISHSSLNGTLKVCILPYLKLTSKNKALYTNTEL